MRSGSDRKRTDVVVRTAKAVCCIFATSNRTGNKKKTSVWSLFVAPQVRFERTTYRLTAGCSTAELLRNTALSHENGDIIPLNLINVNNIFNFFNNIFLVIIFVKFVLLFFLLSVYVPSHLLNILLEKYNSINNKINSKKFLKKFNIISWQAHTIYI